MSDQPLSFPPLMVAEEVERWQWPMPPFAWQHLPAPGNDVTQPCRIESHSGTVVDAQLIKFDPIAGLLEARTRGDGPPLSLTFNRFRRLTLTTALRHAPPVAGAPFERVPAAAHEREYTLYPQGNSAPVKGRTAGYVETEHGMYLFTVVDEEASLERVFVPRQAYVRFEFGPSAAEAAMGLWISRPDELLEAIKTQDRKPVRPLGQSLLELGLVTEYQLKRELARKSENVPIGEALVASGMISSADLRTALAHKMGYPLVDLTRFPIEKQALAKLTQRVAVSYRALPLMIDGDRLIVAVDKPARAQKLREVSALAELRIVPVLAPKLQIMLTLERMAGNVWSHHVPERMDFLDTAN